MNKLLFLYSVIIITMSCSTNHESLDEHNLDNAIWISDNKLQPTSDSLFYLDSPSPLFRKEFTKNGTIESAKLYITAAGYYKATVNGNRVGKDMLAPAWTDFGKRVYYSEYDISSYITKGNNCIGVTLGNGFYNPLPLNMWGERNIRKELTIGNPAFIAKILIRYKGGKTEEIITDGTWKYEYGPLLKNNIYLGEVYDARREIESWDLPEFNDNLWNNVIVDNGPEGKLLKAFFPPVQVTRKITPVDIYSPKEGVYLVDMGINFTGVYSIKLSGKKGDTITFRFGERIYDDGNINPMTSVCGQIKRDGMGGPGAPAIAWQTDSYILKDESAVLYSPDFTFHTYRYMEISGLKRMPTISDIEGFVVHTNVTNSNKFSCSSELLNSIQQAAERTFLSNLISVQSDCAAREKFGYGGDLNAISESYIYNFDMQAFYRKTIYDWVDAMNDSTFVDTAPNVGMKYCGISWESGMLTTQYYLYLYYNDTEIIKELYELDKKWMEKVVHLHPNKIVESGLSDHESLKPVPVELTGTAHYLQCANIMTEFAEVMNDKEVALKYRNLADELKILIKERFWDKPVVGDINRQTLFATLLYHNIIPKKDLEAATDSLIEVLNNSPSEHFNTGIFGTKYILEALSTSGYPNIVFNVVNSPSYPGWGYMVEQGATTIWETWKESDNTYSNCHPMFGTVSEWFYRWLGGIQPNSEYPGFERFYISPSIPDGLDFVKCNYYSPYGEIVSEWKKEGTDSIIFNLKIPDGSSATFKLPCVEILNISINKKGDEKKYTPYAPNIKAGLIKLKSGEYSISISYK